MRIYLDNCCYNRPFDNQNQQRVKEETEVVFSIINSIRNGKNIILGSDTLILEMAQIKDAKKQRDVLTLYSKTATETIEMSEKIETLADDIMSQSSIHRMDALHLASAIIGCADIFLTVDDKLIRACEKLQLKIKVTNLTQLGA